MYLTEHFASFIAHTNYEDLPQDVIVQAKERIMDTVGAAIAGCCNWEYAQSFRQAIAALGTGPLFGSGWKRHLLPCPRSHDQRYLRPRSGAG